MEAKQYRLALEYRVKSGQELTYFGLPVHFDDEVGLHTKDSGCCFGLTDWQLMTIDQEVYYAKYDYYNYSN